MTQEERKQYFKFYRGEATCPIEWHGEPQGIIWSAEKQIEADWDYLISQEPKRPIGERIEEWISLIAGKFDPWDWVKDMEFYTSTPGRGD